MCASIFQAEQTGAEYREFLLRKWGIDGIAHLDTMVDVQSNIERRVRHTAEYFTAGLLAAPVSSLSFVRLPILFNCNDPKNML